MQILGDDLVQKRLSPEIAAAAVLEACAPWGQKAPPTTSPSRTDVLQSDEGGANRAFRLKTVVGVAQKCAFTYSSTAIVDLLPYADTVLPRRALGTAEVELLLLHSLASGALVGEIEGRYVWALSLALSAVLPLAIAVRELGTPTIGFIGAGRQALLQARALAVMVPRARILVFHHSQAQAEEGVSVLRSHAVSAAAVKLREACHEADALAISTSNYLPETPEPWPGSCRAISVTRASEASKHTIEEANVVISDSTDVPRLTFAGNGVQIQKWAERRACSRPVVALSDIMRKGTTPERALFACLRGFSGGPLFTLLIDMLWEVCSELTVVGSKA